MTDTEMLAAMDRFEHDGWVFASGSVAHDPEEYSHSTKAMRLENNDCNKREMLVYWDRTHTLALRGLLELMTEGA